MEKPQEPSSESITQRASESVKAGVGIRERVHDLTLEALRTRRFDSKSVREVVQAVTEGVALGAESSRAEVRQSRGSSPYRCGTCLQPYSLSQ